jgi:THO complex subunit 2
LPKNSHFSDTLLDIIWTIDLNVDSRLESATSHGLASLDDALQSFASPQEQASEARRRLAEIIRDLIHRHVLGRTATAERLEAPLLARVGLISDEREFNRKTIRSNTARLYRQQKFNLLREENEGYSGLINELTLGMGPRLTAVYDSSNGGRPRLIEQESIEERNHRAGKVMNNVSALIGFFDLDPNRVLDLIIDVFSANVVLHWPFFLALLSHSPWAHTEESRSVDTMDVDREQSDNSFGCVSLDISTETGSHTMAQIVGFKFRHYQHPDTKRSNQIEELYLTTAILMREGYLRFVDILSHLSPDDKGMNKLHEQYKEELSDKVMNAKGNALSMAAPLTEDDDGAGALSNAGAGAAGKGSEGKPHVLPNQVLGLLKALLGIGQIRHSLIILSRYPWLCGADKEVASLYSRLLVIIIAPVYSEVSLSNNVAVCDSTSGSIQRFKFDNKKQELVPANKPRLEVTAICPEPLDTGVTSFIYFFADWHVGLPEPTPHEFLDDFGPLLRILGPHLHRSSVLFQKVCRICKHGLRQTGIEPDTRAKWLELIRNILLPALSMTSGNSGLVSEVWVVLRHLSYEERYSLYGEWRYSLYKRPELRVRQAEVEKEAKGILKRISSDNVKLSGRALAKASHANPTIFFTVALNQVQSYSNLIAPIVECAKYLTHFEYDVFGFSLIDALSNPEKDRTKQDGTSVSQWLQSLAAFTGTLYWRYAMMDCTSVLQYIANQLKENNVKDLVLVRELILKMSGIEPLANLSDSQIGALTGGRILSMEAMMMANAGLATTTRMNLRRSGARLMTTLQQSRMLLPLLVLIAQQRQACIHLVPVDEAHLKYLGNLFDTCQEILFQYVEFINTQLEPQQFAELVPTFDDLCRRFELEPAIASHIVRPRLSLAVQAVEARDNETKLRKELLKNQAKKVSSDGVQISQVDTEEVDEDTKAADATEADQVKKEGSATSTEVVDQEVALSEEKEEAKPDKDIKMTPAEVADGEGEDIWKEALGEAYTAAENILTPETQEIIGLRFYATFWQLALSDIAVPTDRYDQEIESLQKIVQIHREGVRGANVKLRKEAQECIQKLRVELKERTLNHQATRRRLQREKHEWFADGVDRTGIVYAVLQECIIPRALLSPTDALFAGRFLKLMHTCGTRNFASLTAYNKIVMELVPSLTFATTENEARNLARFLHTILSDLSVWFKDEKRYVDQVQGKNLPGFQIEWGERHETDVEIPEADNLGFQRYQAVLRKWHNMLRSTFVECFASGEYMRIRNAIVIMTRVATSFPLWETHGVELFATITSLVKDEERGDLKVLGQGLLAMLNKERKGWIPMPRKKKAEEIKVEAVKQVDNDEEKDVQQSSEASSKERAVKQASEPADEPSDTRQQTGSRPELQKSRASSTHKLPARPDVASKRPGREEKADNSVRVTTSDTKRNGADNSVQAARQAVLDSMRDNSSMQPPKGPAAKNVDRDRSGGWDSPAPSSADNRRRDGHSTPRSRAQSPRQQDGHRASADPRAANEGRDNRQTSTSTNGERERSATRPGMQRDRSDRDRDRYDREVRQRESDRKSTAVVNSNARSERPRDTYAAAAAQRRADDSRVPENGNRAAPARSEDRRVDRDREVRDRDRERPRHDDRSGRDRRTDRDPARPSTPNDERTPSSGYGNQTPPNAPRSTYDSRRGPSSLQQSMTSDDPVRPDRVPPSQAPNGPAATRRQETTKTGDDRANSTARETDTSFSSPSGSRKRSLADRLSMSESGGGGGGGGDRGTTSRDEAGVDQRGPSGDRREGTARENEPNKRARISREGDDSDKGITIHGQGRGGGGAGGQYGAARRGPSGTADGYRNGPRDRWPSSSSSGAANRDRDRRRRRAGA